MMHLEMEELEDFFKLFTGKEAETPIFIGQMNYRTETTMSVDVAISTRYVDDGEVTIVSFKDDCGVADIPNQLYDRAETKDIYEAQLKKLENLDVLAEAKKKEFDSLFKEKGYTTYRGIWTDGSKI